MGKIVKFKPTRRRKPKLPGAWRPFIQKSKQPRLWHGAVAAALIGTLIGVKSLDLGGLQLPFISTEPSNTTLALPVTQHVGMCESEGGTTCVVDGDTLHVAGERIRLLGIDAPELPGHCASGRNCAPGDPFAASANLARLLSSGPLQVERIGTDHYGHHRLGKGG